MSQAARLFFRQFLAAPRSVGAVLPSSAALARAMLAPIDFAAAHAIVEFGPGTGAVTRLLRARLAEGARYLGIEQNSVFCNGLLGDFPDLEFVNASVADLETVLDRAGMDRIDAVVSGLPWASLPVALQDRVFPATARRLAPGGPFITFAYVHGRALPAARALRVRLRATFEKVETSPVIWANLPPALCYVCYRAR